MIGKDYVGQNPDSVDNEKWTRIVLRLILEEKKIINRDYLVIMNG
jgi:hypothetical protein